MFSQPIRTGAHRAAVAVLVTAALITAVACTGAKDPADEVSAGRTATSDDGVTPGEGTTATSAAPATGDGTTPPDPALGTTGTAPAPGTGGGTAGTSGGSATGGTGGSGGGGGAAGSGSTLFSPEEDTIGITDTEIRICAHAALTYGAAFNTGEDDLNVYWDALNDAGGVHGRQVRMFYENDNYSPDTARQAAEACKDNHDPFFLVGGIGFDQIPAVRTWAEENRMLYIHHTATVKGTEGQHFSFTGLPTTEKMGEMFAELAIAEHREKSIGIIKRRSENWEPGVAGFKRLAEQHGLNVVYEKDVQVNQANYLSEIRELQTKQVELVWVWLNALETTQFVKQARAQLYEPTFMVFPFNLESQTLGDDALDPRMVGIGMYQAYSHHDRSGEFKRYADDMDQFQAQYAEYRPNADLNGVGGDLIFLAWSSWKALHMMLEACGRDCTRNKLIDTMHGLRFQPTSSYCAVDFTRQGHANRGGWRVSAMETYRAPDGKVNWRNTHTCVEHLV